jgi:hypothetical protein
MTVAADSEYQRFIDCGFWFLARSLYILKVFQSLIFSDRSNY